MTTLNNQQRDTLVKAADFYQHHLESQIKARGLPRKLKQWAQRELSKLSQSRAILTREEKQHET